MIILTCSDWVQLGSASVALLIGVASAYYSHKSIKQTEKIAKESVRPYIVIAHEVIVSPNNRSCLVIKNYGKSAASISDISFNDVVKNKVIGSTNLGTQVSLLKGIMLAPGQRISMSCPSKYFEVNEIAVFHIEYKSNNKIYNDNFSIDVKNSNKILRDDSNVQST